jgi:hypothetical protein
MHSPRFCTRRRAVSKLERAGGDQGAVFAEAVAGGQDRSHPVVRQVAEDFQAGQGVGEQGGLGVAGEFQVFFRPFQAELEKVVADDVVSLLVKPLRAGKSRMRSLPIPTYWEPCPGKTNMICWS